MNTFTMRVVNQIKNKEKTVMATARIPLELYYQMREIANKENVTTTDIIKGALTTFVEDYIKEKEKKKMKLRTKKKKNKTTHINLRNKTLKYIKQKCNRYSNNEYVNEVPEGGYTLMMIQLLNQLGYGFENSPIIRKEKGK